MNLRFPHAGYREKIWDHAAGALIVAEAGARITDAAGAPPTPRAPRRAAFVTAPASAPSPGRRVPYNTGPLRGF